MERKEHFGENDDIREALKSSIEDFLATTLTEGPYQGFKPQVPKWGILMRSQFVSKFPDMRVSAPFDNATQQTHQLEVLRHEQIDNDVMLMLFDREPGDFGKLGISLSPPEHQLTSILGNDDGLNDKGQLTISAVATWHIAKQFQWLDCSRSWCMHRWASTMSSELYALHECKK